jgi:hypothetical protein
MYIYIYIYTVLYVLYNILSVRIFPPPSPSNLKTCTCLPETWMYGDIRDISNISDTNADAFEVV